MVDYSKMSDFEINLAVVHIVIGSGGYDWDSDKKEVYLAAMDGGEFLPNAYFDPCNNPADAWPIISDNRISLMYDQSTEKGNEAQWCLASSPCDKHIVDYVSPSKLLRAAMIVFLMMQDEKNG